MSQVHSHDTDDEDVAKCAVCIETAASWVEENAAFIAQLLKSEREDIQPPAWVRPRDLAR